MAFGMDAERETPRPPLHGSHELDLSELDKLDPIYLGFGGQSISRSPHRELRELVKLQDTNLNDFIRSCCHKLQSLVNSHLDENRWQLRFHLWEWINGEFNDHGVPDMLSPEWNMPLIAIVQLTNFLLLCSRADEPPHQVISHLTGVLGHSQGVITAAFLATVKSKESFFLRANDAITLLYHMGYEVRQAWQDHPTAFASRATFADSASRGLGRPSPMLSISRMSRNELECAIDVVNGECSDTMRIAIALRNSRNSFVVSGPPDCLYRLVQHLQFSQEHLSQRGLKLPRKEVVCQFLATAAPFHSILLDGTVSRIRARVETMQLSAVDMCTDVVGLSEICQKDEDLIEGLISSVVRVPLDWYASLAGLQKPACLIDLGPGRGVGIAKLIRNAISGSGTRSYAIALPVVQHDEQPLTNDVSFLSTDSNSSRELWRAKYRPSLAQQSSEARSVRTKFTDMFGLPPILAAGMTPTSCSVSFVAAVMNAGYYAELATGGYNNAQSLRAAVVELSQNIPFGRLINLNIIYASPSRVAWQIPLIASMIYDGLPVGGLTIGAGVPSIEVAAEYILTLGLSYISFKPSSADTIRNVLTIAQRHPGFPILIQWTGGRSGGHHSLDDFHEPLLETYTEIREHDNVCLVVGSGFGDNYSDAWRYISGSWSRDRDGGDASAPEMPLDGILYGTAMMTCLEADTSTAAKQAMVTAAGVPDEEWQSTMQQASGGIISIISEMGEPMHVVATRGMRLWAELDRSLFCLSRSKRLDVLRSRRSELMERLNADYQKVWFGWDFETQKPAALSDMTYYDVLRRLLMLTQSRMTGVWTHPSYKQLFDDMLHRTHQRLGGGCTESALSAEQSLKSLREGQTSATRQLVTFEDACYFIDRCMRPGEKPTPFIPVFDDKFETWFKKDSLWQSEALERTHHNDVERVCILAGPVSVQHVRQIDQSVSDFLDQARYNFVQGLDEVGEHDSSSFPSLNTADDLLRKLQGVVVEGCSILIPEDATEMPDNDIWLLFLDNLGRDKHTEGQGILAIRRLFSETGAYENPIRRLFTARPGIRVVLSKSSSESTLELFEADSDHQRPSVSLIRGLDTTRVLLTTSGMIRGSTELLEIPFQHHLERPYAPFTEISQQRKHNIRELYRALWLGKQMALPDGSPQQTFQFPSELLSRQQLHSLQMAVWGAHKDSADDKAWPVEFLVPVAWKAIITPLFCLDCDLSALLHLQTSCHTTSDVGLPSPSEVVDLISRIRRIEKRGQDLMVEVEVEILREDIVVAKLGNQFLLVGQDSSVAPFLNPDCKSEGLSRASVSDEWARGESNEGSFEIVLPSDCTSYSMASGDHNPIHTSNAFARYAGLPSSICHGMNTNALVVGTLRNELLAMMGKSSRAVLGYDTEFCGMVFPGETLKLRAGLSHGSDGKDMIEFVALREERGDVVVRGSITIQAQPTGLVFTGQGSQFPGMGMDLREQSPHSQGVWTRADRYFEENWGKYFQPQQRNKIIHEFLC